MARGGMGREGKRSVPVVPNLPLHHWLHCIMHYTLKTQKALPKQCATGLRIMPPK